MKVFGLIGYPLGHSWSGTYFNQKFKKEGLDDCLYEIFPLRYLTHFNLLLEQNKDLAGLNVTIPYKIDIIPYLDDLDEDAAAIGAINCIEFIKTGGETRLKGHNTDWVAILKTFTVYLDRGVKKALVLGTGGAARAVAFALQKAGVPYDMVSRSRDKGSLTYSELDKRNILDYRLIVNATPAGMDGFPVKMPPIPYEGLTSGHILYDLNYNPSETEFLKRGKDAGTIVLNGMDMLIAQAELSWQIWNQES